MSLIRINYAVLVFIPCNHEIYDYFTSKMMCCKDKSGTTHLASVR
jgi:hypothetical protein